MRTQFQKFMDGVLHSLWEKLTGLHWNYRLSNDENITIGEDCHIGINVHFITVNPNRYDIWKKDFNGKPMIEPIIIEDECFIGSNSVILPSVHLGKHTLVGAGSIVTRSFPDGYCIVAGNPARLIRKL